MPNIKSTPSIKHTNFSVVLLRKDFDQQNYSDQETQNLVKRMQSACKLPVFIR